jgi:hypothetical protein
MNYFTTGSGRIELQISSQDAHTGHHAGQCDADIAYLLTVDYIKTQIDAIPPALLAEELREYGAWNADELSDHEQNKARILWLACGDITDQETQNADY